MTDTDSTHKNKKLLKFYKNLAAIAAVFTAIVGIILIINFLQLQASDPLESESLKSLMLRLEENPQDQQLKEEIRALDLIVRKAFFTKQWQIRVGSYLLLFGLIVLLIAYRQASQIQQKITDIPEGSEPSVVPVQRKTQNRMIIGGSAFFLLALLSSFLSYNEISADYGEVAGISKQQEITDKKMAEQQTAISEPREQKTKTDVKDPDETEQDNMIKTNTDQSARQDTLAEKTMNEGDIAATPQSQAETKAYQEADVADQETEITKSVETKEEKPSETGNMVSTSFVPAKIPGAVNQFPNLRGAGANGISFHNNIPTEWDGASGKNIAWKTEIPLPGYSSPIVWGNKVFLSGGNKSKREVYCFDAHSGQILWTGTAENIEGSPKTPPKVTDDTGYSAPTLATDGKYVIAIFATGDIICYDFSGQKIWAKNIGVPKNHYGHSSSLIIYGESVIVQFDDRNSGNLYAFSVKDGSQKWHTKRDVKISWSSPVIVNTGNRDELLTSSDPYVISYDPSTGKEFWKYDCMSGEVGPSPAFGSGLVFAANEYATLAAIKPGENPELVWEDYEYLPEVSSPLVVNGLLFIATSYGVLVCYDAKDGEKYWEHEFDNGFYASPVFADGNIFLIDMSGVMHIFKPEKKYKQKSKPALGEKAVCTPAFKNGEIYLRGKKHLFCIRK
jgi:outer membrane protein assembly factor BamB